MSRQKILMIVFGVITGVLCVVALIFVVMAIGSANEAEAQRNSLHDELQRIYQSKMFPSEENVKRVQEDQKALETWLGNVSNVLHVSEGVVDATQTPPRFKQVLQNTVRSLIADPRAHKTVIASDFKFGFDKYLGESDSLPSKEHVVRLSQQLNVIQALADELLTCKISKLERVGREMFDDAEADKDKPQETGGRRRGRQAAVQQPQKQAVAKPAEISDLFTKQQFVLEFQARPAEFAQVVNRLASMDLFVVVSEIEFQKTDDPMTQWEQRKKESSKKRADETEKKVDLAKVPHAERIVSEPTLDPPVRVKITLDVYTFTGV